MMVSPLAIICGHAGWTGIHAFAADHLPFLQAMLPTLVDIPSPDTIARVIRGADKIELYLAFAKLGEVFLRRHLARRPGRRKASDMDVLAVDGKTVRGAVPPGMDASLTHIVNAVCEFITMAVHTVPEKSNEIIAIPMVLELLDRLRLLKSKIVTIDAMGCQKKIADMIHQAGAFYLFNLKGNQTGLHKEVISMFGRGLKKYPEMFDVSTHATGYDKAAGRIEHRTITMITLNPSAMAWLTKAADWAGIKSVMCVERWADPPYGSKKKRIYMRRFFVSSLSLPPERMLEITVKHWMVETVHNMLDVTFGEDKCKVWKGEGPEYLSILRKLALNVLVPVAKPQRRQMRSEVGLQAVLQRLGVPHGGLDLEAWGGEAPARLEAGEGGEGQGGEGEGDGGEGGVEGGGEGFGKMRAENLGQQGRLEFFLTRLPCA
jgi:predicted transposase YbfD/YdcC